jgi:Arc/MetJ family transcription regulator
MRTHIVVDESLIQEVDRVAGKRRRSRFVEEAIREKLTRETLGAALTSSAGALDPADYPAWQTPEQVTAWVKASREEDDRRLSRKHGAQSEG